MPITHERMGSAHGVPSWRGVRTTRYAYWTYQGGGTELYDMAQDPGSARHRRRRSRVDAEAGRAERQARDVQRRGVPQP